MKTRDIKTVDSAGASEENQEIKKVVQPLSPSQPTRQRAPRNSQKAAPQPQSTADVQKNETETTTVAAEPVDRDMIVDRRDALAPKEDHYRPQQQSQHHTGGYDRPVYTKRPLEDLSLAELVQYARRYGIMGAAITKKDELLKKVRYAEENPNFEMAVDGVL
jgi:hypothetical protein